MNNVITYKEKRIAELQDVDCNCNECFYFQRNVEATRIKNNNISIKANKVNYGYCGKLKKDIAEIANICLLHTQKCFENRRTKI